MNKYHFVILSFFFLFIILFFFGNKHKKNLIKTIAWLAKPLTFATVEPLPDWFNFLQEDEICYLQQARLRKGLNDWLASNGMVLESFCQFDVNFTQFSVSTEDEWKRFPQWRGECLKTLKLSKK